MSRRAALEISSPKTECALVPSRTPARAPRACTLLVAALASLPAAAQATTVRVTVDTTGDSARLVLTHSAKVDYVIEASRERLRVTYAEPVQVDPPTARYEGPILAGYRLRDDRTLLLDLGRDYERYETFELRNPFRVVLDLRAPSRTARGPAPPGAATAATIVVIDPGHGGVENGAVGPSGLLEKDVALDLARALKRELEGTGRATSVVLTRDEDRLVGLDERTAIANHNRADLFLSIHLNASPRAQASGAETYYLSTDATDDEARTLAALENRTGGETRPDRRVQEGSLDLVLWDLAQTQYLHESSLLAESIQRHLDRLTGTRNRGVRQAPFRVLMGAMMPAVLVEVGFISNAEEETLLRSPEHRARVVEALAAAVGEFLDNLERYSAPGAAGLDTGSP
jgi:N-acetylmuramoyl-L-alanine amidase